MDKRVIVNIAGKKVICNANELTLIVHVFNALNGYSLGDSFDSIIAPYKEGKECQTTTFNELNKPVAKDEELDVSVWHDESMSNDKADALAQEKHGVYFNTIIWLDGCDTCFRTSKEY